MNTKKSDSQHKVIDLFSGKPLSDLANERIVRLAPENDGLCMLYSNDDSERFFAMPILCWGLRFNGEVVGLVPWVNQLTPCPDIQDDTGCWQAYYDPDIDQVFYEAPMHKVVELETAMAYFEPHLETEKIVLQEIPDNIGTHAMLTDKDKKSLTLTEVVSWRLHLDGTIHGMLVDSEKIQSTPVLAGDDCLYPADENPDFYYYFQHHIANQIKNEDPETLNNIAKLLQSR